MPTWPIDVNTDVSRDDYEEGFADVMIRSQTDHGPAKRRRRFTAAPRELTVTHVFNETELDQFITFFDTTIQGGALSFSYPHPRTGETVTVSFTRTPEPAVPFGVDRYKVRLELEIQP